MSKNSISDYVGFKLRKYSSWKTGASFAVKFLKQQMAAQDSIWSWFFY